jgi:hypothetical protein
MYQLIPSHSRLDALPRNAPRFKFAPSFHPSSILCQLQRTHTNALDINTLSMVCCVCYTWFRAWIVLKLSSNLALRHTLSRFHHSALSVPHTLSSHTHTHTSTSSHCTDAPVCGAHLPHLRHQSACVCTSIPSLSFLRHTDVDRHIGRFKFEIQSSCRRRRHRRHRRPPPHRVHPVARKHGLRPTCNGNWLMRSRK